MRWVRNRVAASSGTSPSLMKPMPKRARSEARIPSKQRTCVTPTPMHTPLTAAMSGFDRRHRSTQSYATLAPVVPGSDAAAVASRSANVSPMSAPAQNARPAPVTTMAPISALAFASRIACESSRPIARVPGVELLRPVERDQQHVAALLGEDGLGHGRDRTGRGRDCASGPPRPRSFLSARLRNPTRSSVTTVPARKCRRSGGVRECACGARSPRGVARDAPLFGTRTRNYRPRRDARGRHGSRSARARSATPRNAVVTVASFDFAESRLLAEIYAGALERAGVPVHRALGLGPRELVAPALVRGLVDVVPEYAGTAVQFLSLGRADPEPDVAATHAALVDALEGTPARALAPAPAQDANAFVVRREVADRLDLASLSDLRDARGSVDLRWATRMRHPPVVPRGVAQGLRRRVRRGRSPGRRRSAHPSGAQHRDHRRRAPLQHRPCGR